jgi:hypothetical protein
MVTGAASAAEPAPDWTKPAEGQMVPSAPPPQPRIKIARQVGINNWAVPNDQTVYIQDNHRQWYKAELLGHCPGITFATHLGFDFEPNGDFDKFSAIHYGHQRCPLTSLILSDAPVSHKGKVAQK